jgi:hypothetical protein
MKSHTPIDESNLLEKIETALKHAVREDPDLNWDYGTQIKRQKYVYLAVDHFTQPEEELPVTFSWYKFGAVMPAAPETGTIGPVGTQMPTSPGRESSVYTTAFDELVAFFGSGSLSVPLNSENWYSSDLDFLWKFYETHAPEEYQDMYLGNVALRMQFGRIRDRLNECEHSVGTDASGEIVLRREQYEEVGRAAARLHLGIVGARVDETLNQVRRFTDLLEGATLVLTNTTAGEVTQAQVRVFEQLEESYNQCVWEYPSLLVSKQTATGPNASTLRKWSTQKHFRVEDNIKRHVDEAEASCEDTGLVPSSSDYPEHDDTTEAIGRELALGAMRRDN